MMGSLALFISRKAEGGIRDLDIGSLLFILGVIFGVGMHLTSSTVRTMAVLATNDCRDGRNRPVLGNE